MRLEALFPRPHVMGACRVQSHCATQRLFLAKQPLSTVTVYPHQGSLKHYTRVYHASQPLLWTLEWTSFLR